MPPDYDGEVAFISGVNADGTLALDSYAAWNDGTIPADYSGGYTLAYKWGGTTAGTAGGTISYYFDPSSNWSATEKSMFAAGLALWSAVANISFTLTTSASAAQIIFKRGTDGEAQTEPQFTGGSQAGKTGGTVLEHETQATISIDTSVSGFGPITGSFASSGGYPILTLLHEEGHAIGLGHAGPYNATVNAATQQFGPYDSQLWSIMSYISPATSSAEYYGQYPVTGTHWGGGNFPNVPTTVMPLDILAAQRLYGMPTSTPLSGGQVFGFNTNIVGAIAPFFDFNQNTLPVITLWDMGGNNTLDISGFSQGATINLAPGSFSSVAGLINNIGIAFGTMIDTVIGGPGNDTMTGNTDVDYLYGGSGNDILNGAGNDVLDGGFGNDILNGAAGGGDTASYADANAAVSVNLGLTGAQNTGAGGTDTLNNISSLVGGKYSDVLTAGSLGSLIHGGDGDDTLNGGVGNDMLYGDAGDDTLSGGGGNDLLDGGPGNNTVSYAAATGGVTVSLLATGAQAVGGGQGMNTLSNFTGVIGSGFNDTLTIGSPGKTYSASGGAGSDVINDSGAASFDDGGDGTDVLNLDWTTNIGAGIGFVAGGVSNTYGQGQIKNIEILNLKTSAAGASASFIEPFRAQGMSDSWVATSSANDTVTVDLSADANPVSLGGSGNAFSVGDSTGTLVSLTNIDNFRITGGSGNDTLMGGAGNDILNGGAGRNVIQGGAGNDIIIDSGNGGSTLDGGGGTNALTLDWSAMTASTTISFVPGVAQTLQGGTSIQNFQFLNIFTGSGDDNFFYDNPEQASAPPVGAFYDQVDAGAGNDTFRITFDSSTFSVTAAQGGNFTQFYHINLFSMDVYNVENFDVTGSSLDDTLSGALGNDTLNGGPGNDTLNGGGGTNTVSFSTDAAGVVANLQLGTASGAASGNDTLANFQNITGGSGGDTLTGDGGANVLSGGAGNDVLRGNGGTNTLDGGAGTDIAAYALMAGDYYVRSNAGGGYTVQGPSANDPVTHAAVAPVNDTLTDIEDASFDGSGQTLTLTQFAAQSFNPLDYIASYPDLIAAFGDNSVAGLQHFEQYGYFEGRNPGTFNALQYIASYPDLIAAFGDNQTAGLEHYITYGYHEGRTPTFNALQYIASYPDLIAAFGDNQTAGLEHYINYGNHEGRTPTFNALQYIASYPDLIAAFGDNQTAGLEHYINYGYHEGRTVNFDPVAYLLTYPDLQAAGLTAQTAARHYIDYGYHEGRSPSGAFGTEQTQNALTLGTSLGDTIGTAGDEDWFSINLTAGQSYNLTLSGADSASGTLADPLLQLRNANGILVMSDNDNGAGHDSLIHLTASATGLYYLVAASNTQGATGTYKILAASA